MIEGPIDEVKDFVGWDLQKALKLLMKGNAPLIEWLHSPIVYKDNLWLRENLIRLFNNNSNFNALYRGYFGLAMNNFKAYLTGESVKPKNISMFFDQSWHASGSNRETPFLRFCSAGFMKSF